VELGRQIQERRERMGLTQDELAQRIYVSRQTISNWENDHTYPDIHSLLLLSTLFATTIDNLVKGDIEMMKKTVGRMRLKVWTWVMLALSVVGAVSIMPAMHYWGNWGLALPIGIELATVAASVVTERIKKRNNLQTYSEILSFAYGTPRDEERIAKERQRLIPMRILMAVVAAAFGAIVAVVYMLFLS
jgi:DNA-binding XRE family transcriptional regulator